MVRITIDQEEVRGQAKRWEEVKYIISDDEEGSSKKVKLGNVFQ